jgi:sulfate adenylyltransferase
MSEFHLNRQQYLELEKLGLGAFSPQQGFMNEDEVRSVADGMRLPGGEPFPIPIILDLSPEDAERLKGTPRVALVFEGTEVGEISPENFFRPDKGKLAKQVYGTDEVAHPGVAHLMEQGEVFVGGPVLLKQRVELDISEYELTPEQTKARFVELGWQSVIGFQTRNVPHRAHEYLQRVGLETSDGLFVQPLVGRKKKGDYTPEAVIRGYQALIDGFFPANRVLLGVLSTSMRYAGPREAVFHAIIRRNYGCTKFIVGRDHAGVGNYYGKYEAHDLTRQFDSELGIEIVRLNGPYYCRRCDGIATEQTCPHHVTDPAAVHEISGTDMRAILVDGKAPEPHIMRPEIVASLEGVSLFVEENDC